MAGFGALGAECSGDVGGENDALARLAVDASPVGMLRPVRWRIAMARSITA
jgi:hypothetical protein